MSWLSTLFDNNRNFVGNATKNLAPLLALTPAGWLGAGLAGLGGALALVPTLGSEFLPKLDEGNIWLTMTLPPSASLQKSKEVEREVR